MRWLVAAACLPLLAFSASASLVEDATDGAVAYQFDAGTHHDAPDVCELASDVWHVPVGNATDAMLVPQDDVADHITFTVTPDLVGSRVTVLVGAPEVPLDLAV